MTAWMNGVAMKMRKAEAGAGGVGGHQEFSLEGILSSQSDIQVWSSEESSGLGI